MLLPTVQQPIADEGAEAAGRTGPAGGATDCEGPVCRRCWRVVDAMPSNARGPMTDFETTSGTALAERPARVRTAALAADPRSAAPAGSTAPPAGTAAPAAPGLAVRIGGMAGAVALFAFGMTLQGGHPIVLLQIPVLLTLAAITGFGLLASHGPRLFGRLCAAAVGAMASDRAEAECLRAMCRRGRRLCHTAGLVCLLGGVVHVLSVLDHPSLIGPGAAFALIGMLDATLVAELLFGSAEHWIRSPQD